MARQLGPILFVALMLVAFSLRALALRQAGRIGAGEAHVLATIQAVRKASEKALGGGGSHPGLAGLPALPPGLRCTPADTPERTWAEDGSYLYGLHTTTRRDDEGHTVHGYILRAWPLRFGVTGNLEYVLQDDQLWESRNRLGRSGRAVGYPPAFPEPSVGQPGSPWRRVEETPGHR